MSTSVVVVGAGGFGREVVDVIEAVNAESGRAVDSEVPWRLLGVLDDSPSQTNLDRLAARGVPYLGVLDSFLAGEVEDVAYVVGIGSPVVRRRIAERFDAAGSAAATLVHPSVTRGANVTLGPGSVLCAGVQISTNITIGRHVHVNPNATVGHDTTIGDFVSINPMAAISGDCEIEPEVLVGVGGIVLNQLRVGAGAVVGGGACVVKDVAPGTTVVGVPARPLER